MLIIKQRGAAVSGLFDDSRSERRCFCQASRVGESPPYGGNPHQSLEEICLRIQLSAYLTQEFYFIALLAVIAEGCRL
jgi:hypothetical protein